MGKKRARCLLNIYSLRFGGAQIHSLPHPYILHDSS